MQIHQFTTSFSYGDAIGNEAVEIRDYLRDKGYESEIFSLFYHPRYANQIIDYREYDKYSDRDNIVIFHFSIGSPVTKKFLRIPDRKVIIYHNITPHHFFLDYHRTLAKDCFKGRIELKSIKDKVDLALGDSIYNEQELIEAGYPNTGVLPLVMNFEKFNIPVTPVIKELFDDNKINLLFVGRIIPNKKVEDVIKSYHLYKKYFNPNSRLIIVGESRGFERYKTALDRLIGKLKVTDIHFTGHIPDDELISYFKLADVYLHMSEHEGFCAPVPESFYLKKPVIAFNAGAVKETMRGGGILVNNKSFLRIAGLIDAVLGNSELKQKILDKQSEVVKSYFKNRTGEILLEKLQGLIG
jgi:glycosyltransferase involved in cell wall biosynthesis